MYITERVAIESIMKKEITMYKYPHDFNTKFWFFLVPFLIILPTKYEVRIFSIIFKRRNFRLIIFLAINVLYRYYRSYKKLFDNSLKNNAHFPIL